MNPSNMQNIDLTDVMASHMLPQLKSPGQCIMRFACKKFSTWRPRGLTRFAKAAQFRRGKGGNFVPVYRWKIDEIETIWQCDMLIGPMVTPGMVQRLEQRPDRCTDLEDRDRDFVKMLQTQRVYDNHVILEWIETNSLISSLRVTTVYVIWKYINAIAKFGDYKRLEMWIKKTLAWNKEQTDGYHCEGMIQVFMNTDAPFEDKIALVDMFSRRCSCRGEKSITRDSVAWSDVMRSKDVDVIQWMTNYRCHNANHDFIRMDSKHKDVLPHSPQIMDWMIASLLMDPKAKGYYKQAVTENKIDMMQHMNTLRFQCSSSWFPYDIDIVDYALNAGNIDCAEYLIKMGCGVRRFTYAPAISYGRVSTIKMIEARGIPLPDSPFDFVNMSYDDQQRTIEIIDYLMSEGYPPDKLRILLCLAYECEEILVHLHKLKIPDLQILPEYMEQWAKRSIQLNEYVDKHADLKFKWGPDPTSPVEYVGWR